MPKLKVEATGLVSVLLLIDCAHGKCGTVAQLSAADAEAAVKDGVADAAPEAVAAVSE